MNRELLITIYICVLVIFFLLSFFFSSSDMVYGSVDILHLESELKKNNKKSVKYAYQLTRDYDNTISTILFLNDTVNAGIDSVATLLGVNLAYVVLANPTSAITENWGLVASMIALILKIIFGEITAKSIGKIFNFKFSILYSKIINALNYICLPITFLVANFGKLITYPITHGVTDIEISEDDLHEMVDDIKDQGSVDEEKANLLHDTITYTQTEAYEIMTPRVDIYAIDYDDDIEEVMEDSNLFKYSRVPVYEGTIDNIIGFVKTRALMLAKINNKNINLKEILHEPLRFPRSIEINDVLKEFKKKKQHFALIMDEYGGVEGILTLEDILEELVGEIWDEKDDPDTIYTKRNDGTYIVDGKLNLEDFCELFDLDYDKLDTEYVTIGGFCVELLDDKFAKLNDVIEYKNLEMKVIALDKNGSIDKLLIKVNQKEEDD
ncbi:MAG: hemolysin family protein [Mollicutes bacterium]|nr:hemolysin family protein [Mollicutes bacterium]MDD7263504.1 hemolysin family protein [bacterium]MDY4979348.1 hemolysin family protein [Candidatus Onthovivens sp.]